jgi:sugar O-acyltransferase (sialic acid O-acetyltransferase NeuD family)
MVRVIIVGAGGHAQVVADILLRMDEQNATVRPIGLVDDNPAMQGEKVLGLPILGTIDQLSNIPHDTAVVAIGDNKIRRRLFEKLRSQGECFTVACHPNAVIAPDVRLGPGSMICAGVIINSGTTVGANVILNTGCTADHHNQIGDHSHIAPGVHLGGNVTIGNSVLIGIGATVMPRCRVDSLSVVGAGAVVIDDIPGETTVIGVPARPRMRLSSYL